MTREISSQPDLSVLIALQDSLFALRSAAVKIEMTLPAEVLAMKQQAANHSPDPWNLVYHHYLATDCDPAMLLALSLRSALADPIAALFRCVLQAENAMKQIGSLTLAKTKQDLL